MGWFIRWFEVSMFHWRYAQVSNDAQFSVLPPRIIRLWDAGRIDTFVLDGNLDDGSGGMGALVEAQTDPKNVSIICRMCFLIEHP